jgi:FkbM family methyltransferase
METEFTRIMPSVPDPRYTSTPASRRRTQMSKRTPSTQEHPPRVRTDTLVTFDYIPRWAADPEKKRPVHIELRTFAADDFIGREIRETGTFFEIELLEHLALRGPPNGVFIDVGANIGNHAVFFGKFLADHVVCLEPHPGLVPILTRNLKANAITAASVLAYAAGQSAGRGYISRVKELVGKNIGNSSVQHDRPEQGFEVQIEPLDLLFARVEPGLGGRRVTCMKIDVEGWELDVLRGATGILRSQRPQLIIELASREARAAARTFLEDFGYEDTGYRFGWTPTFHFIDPRVHRLRDSPLRPTPDASADRMRAMEAELAALVAPGAGFILVDQEEIASGLVLDDRTRWPFLEKDGQYWGPPADDATAIRELQRLQRSGARYIVFARHGFWWLDYYKTFADYLRRHGERIASNDRFIAFRLSNDIPDPC